MGTFGSRLKNYISDNFGNIKEFAKIVDVAPAQITFYLNDTRFPGGEILKKFADTGCNINWLLTGKGEMLVNSQQILIPEEPPRIHPDDIELIANNVFEKFKELFTINPTISTN